MCNNSTKSLFGTPVACLRPWTNSRKNLQVILLPLQSISMLVAIRFLFRLSPATLQHSSQQLIFVRITRLPQGWTNSVSVFQRIMLKILWLHLQHAKPFLHNVGIHGPEVKDVAPGSGNLCWNMWKFWRESCDIFGVLVCQYKSLAMPGIAIVGMVCNFDGRHPEARKVQKILDWPLPKSIRMSSVYRHLRVLSDLHCLRVFDHCGRLCSFSGRRQDLNGRRNDNKPWKY
jgi:hypothetical protein